jgi:hypothetical protein
VTAEEKRLRALLVEALKTIDWMNDKINAEWGPGDDSEEVDLMERITKALERSEASKRGKSNRSRGHTAERDVCAYLRANGFPDAATTRSVLGSDGTRQPGDVTFAPGVVLSVKHVKTCAWPAWIRQVKEEAQQAGPAIPDTFSPRIPVVVHRLLGETDVGEWPTAVPINSWDGVIFDRLCGGRCGDYARLLDDLRVADGEVVCHTPGDPPSSVAVMRFRTFVDAVRLDR